jgi:hypothetical protein
MTLLLTELVKRCHFGHVKSYDLMPQQIHDFATGTPELTHEEAARPQSRDASVVRATG